MAATTTIDAEGLRAALRALGFDTVRFAAAASVVAGDFAAWLEAGNHADMAWLERGRDKRLDPQRVLAGARSAIVLGVNYLPADARAAAQGRWAKYALHADYHDTLGDGLRAAARVVEQRLGLTSADHRYYVDTGPVLERGWAARAGLGWRGKNAMLISREHGNWLLLAVILVRAELPADEPLLSRRTARPGVPAREVGLLCGSCTRCLDACPTSAFPKPGWVDARRCISYHTIENRGVIPRELRAQFGGRVFGCDTCLDVCPWNRFAQAGRSVLLTARHEIAGLTLLDLLAMDETRFREVFRRTPIKRSKLQGLLRNACIAAGNWDHSPEWHVDAGVDRAAVIAAVERLCAHASELVRAHAVWALYRLLGHVAAGARLEGRRRVESSAMVREEYVAAESAD
ncbi:MAG: tRNA epoxyqueuosine(34) reductase QueG [Opitutaceae bacterium]|nr:tRNA epoxyqueuosine(34) reductase QueG [Opitutaceae bacterium]